MNDSCSKIIRSSNLTWVNNLLYPWVYVLYPIIVNLKTSAIISTMWFYPLQGSDNGKRHRIVNDVINIIKILMYV